ncbi:VCBS repeat-containing protein [Candidatus Uhrbacteria bacterium]|nr:VCBS repeat-containing protein [Candidatus Uhrbacteria bacterium]
MFRSLTSAVLIIVMMFSFFPGRVFAKTNTNNFVRSAIVFLWGGSLLDNNIERLAKFDLLVLGSEAQVYNSSFFSNIRKLNPDIIILAYVPTVSWNDAYWTDPLHKAMYPNIKSDWWLKDVQGNQKSVWPNTRALNLNSGWIDYLSSHVKNDLLSTGNWDGIFYDEVQDSISWVGATDVNNDGQTDSVSEADALWAENYKKLFENTRAKVGNDTIIITNGSSNPLFAPYINGRMFETFPSSHNTLAEWKNMTNQYFNLEKIVGYDPDIFFINSNTDNTGGVGTQQDYQAVRFGLTTTLLGDGYFGYDAGSTNHAVIWEYDEYDVALGDPKETIKNVDIGVWQRDYTQGKVIVNATEKESTINLGGDFEKLHGTQDPKTNDGSIISNITIKSKDGIILLRPIEELLNTTFLNGAFARVFSANGKQKRTGFFAYNSLFRGGTQVVTYDLDNDGKRETVVADETYVSIYREDETLQVKFAPYTETFKKGINIAVGDIENDGSVEIVTGTENGGGPHVRVFNKDGVLINPGFFAYAKNFRGGVNVAIGDLNGDGIKEIVTGAGYKGGPHVRVYNKDGKLINPGFFAYNPSFRGGVNVSVADVDGDKIDDIITGPGIGGEPLARVFNKDGKLKNEFYVFDKKERNGLKVVANDVDGDGRAEVLGLTTNVFTLSGFKE